MWRHTTEPGVCGVSSTSRARHFGGSCYIRRQLACRRIGYRRIGYRVSVYRVSAYRVSGRIGQHTFQSRRSCSSQTVYRTFCRRSQTTQRRHNLLPTPMTPSAPAQPSTDAHRPLSFGKNRGIFGETAHADNADLYGLDAGTTGESRQSAKSDSPRGPSSCATHFACDGLRTRPSSCTTVLTPTRGLAYDFFEHYSSS